MTSFFGPRRRNRRIKNLLVAAVLVVVAFLAYQYLKNDDSSDVTSSTNIPESASTMASSSVTETPVATPTPSDPTYVILTREYQWLVPSIEVMELQELLGIGADGLYGPGTREAHVAALEENGLSLSGVPDEPSGCTIVIGEDICGIQIGNLMEIAIPAITEGLGSPTQEAGWYTECETQYRTIYWGALYVDFTRSELVEPKVVRWGIRNSFHVIDGWEKTFPSIVRFPESLLVDWNPNEPSAPISITDLPTPGGPLIVPEPDLFEEAIGAPLLYNFSTDEFSLRTADYVVVFSEYSGEPPGSVETEFRWEFTDTIRLCETPSTQD